MARRRFDDRDATPTVRRQVNPAGPLYDVRAGGHTIEWTDDVRTALAAAAASRRRDVEVWRLVNGTAGGEAHATGCFGAGKRPSRGSRV